MSDFLKALEAKSDQWNAADIVGEDRTFTIVGVKVNLAAEQKVSIQFKESSDKVWRPCKGMGRVMADLWRTGDPQSFIGKQVTLFCDPDVTYGPSTVGGIRIRAMSDIPGPRSVTVKTSKTKYKQYQIAPIAGAPKPAPQPVNAPGASTAPNKAKAAAESGVDAFRAWFNTDEGKECRASGALTPDVLAECRAIASGADELRARMAANPLPIDLPMDADPMAD